PLFPPVSLHFRPKRTDFLHHWYQSASSLPKSPLFTLSISGQREPTVSTTGISHQVPFQNLLYFESPFQAKENRLSPPLVSITKFPSKISSISTLHFRPKRTDCLHHWYQSASSLPKSPLFTLSISGQREPTVSTTGISHQVPFQNLL